MGRQFDEAAVYTNLKAQLSAKSRGRISDIDNCPYRSEYQRDVHRILYSKPFRRLKHKTQVFFLPDNDHICTRMEHVMQVASAARTVARHLRLNEDLTEAIGLGHDLGHAPFGHHGEGVLSEIAEEIGLDVRFQHEIHGLRVVDKLAAFDRETSPGLNLTYEVRDGIISHCGEDFGRECIPTYTRKSLENIVKRSDALTPCTLEGCIVRMVDKICYAGRDLEDGITAKLIHEEDIPIAVKRTLGANNGEITGKLLVDLITTSAERGDAIALSKDMHAVLKELIEFNYAKIYKCAEVELFKAQATHLLKQLFYRLLEDIQETDRFSKKTDKLPKASVYGEMANFTKFVGYTANDPDALIVLDFISGMTDNYVIRCVSDIYIPKSIV